jgi:glycosyltransferase involved in cell wall biosynthesis
MHLSFHPSSLEKPKMKAFIFPIEPLETRYTGEWYKELPKQLGDFGIPNITLEGKQIDTATTPGAFLNFNATNVYKSSQLMTFVQAFSHLDKDDVIIFTDAWNPCAIQVRYMLDLAGKKNRMIGLWHAGSYDEHDFLGRAFDKRWSYPFEQSLYYAYDTNVFATEFSRDLMMSNLLLQDKSRSLIAGWPMEYLRRHIKRAPKEEKENIVLFPHRLSPEKQPDVFDKLAKRMPEFQFIKCQEQNLTKPEYHALLQKAKVVFSASLQETLGIGVYEGLLAGAAPIMPKALSYREMWKQHKGFLYDSGLSYPPHIEFDLQELEDQIREMVTDDDYREALVTKALNSNIHSYFDGYELYKHIKNEEVQV